MRLDQIIEFSRKNMQLVNNMLEHNTKHDTMMGGVIILIDISSLKITIFSIY